MNDEAGNSTDAINDMRQYLESARSVHVTNAHALEFERCGYPACLHARRVQEWLRNLELKNGK